MTAPHPPIPDTDQADRWPTPRASTRMDSMFREAPELTEADVEASIEAAAFQTRIERNEL